jgi:hypothetical protein
MHLKLHFLKSAQLKLWGEKVTDVDMLEKTYTTFHASNVLVQHHKGNRGRGRGRDRKKL